MWWKMIATIGCVLIIIIIWKRSSKTHPLRQVKGFWNKVLAFLRYY